MIQKFLIAAAGTAAIALISSTASSQTLPVEWTIAPATKAADVPTVHLSLSYRSGGSHSMNSRAFALSDLQGLTPQALASEQGAPVSFRILREAGSFDCNGIVRQARGAGECTFSPDSGFSAALERRGIARPDLHQQYQLAVQNVGSPLLDELKRQGYSQPDLKGLVAAGIHGVTVPYVRQMADSGYRLSNVHDLVTFRIHGVTSDYVREMSVLNPPGGKFSADELVKMRIHGVTAAKAREFAELGYRDLSHDQLMKMSIHGVTPTFVRELAKEGYRGLGADELVRMRIHGVTPAYVRGLRAAGYKLPSSEQLVRMRISGFRPDRRK